MMEGQIMSCGGLDVGEGTRQRREPDKGGQTLGSFTRLTIGWSPPGLEGGEASRGLTASGFECQAGELAL